MKAVSRREAFKRLIAKLTKGEWYHLEELRRLAPPYAGQYRLSNMQISLFLRELRAKGIAEHKSEWGYSKIGGKKYNSFWRLKPN